MQHKFDNNNLEDRILTFEDVHSFHPPTSRGCKPISIEANSIDTVVTSDPLPSHVVILDSTLLYSLLPPIGVYHILHMYLPFMLCFMFEEYILSRSQRPVVTWRSTLWREHAWRSGCISSETGC